MDLRLSDEQEMIRRTVRALMEDRVAPRAAEIDEREEFPTDVYKLMQENEIFALVCPPEYGGVDGEHLTLCVAIEEVARVCGSSSMLLGNQSLGSTSLVRWGNDEQKQKYLPGIASGELLCSFALTEPDAGSDVAGMTSRAVPDGDYYVISGQKCFITESSVAGLFTFFAKVATDKGDQITAFLVEADIPGVIRGPTVHKMGLRGSPTGEVILEEARVHKSQMLGQLGKGMRIALDTLDKGRITVAAMATGLAQGALEYAQQYARERQQFGQPIIRHQQVGAMLADMATEVAASRHLYHAAAWRLDNHMPDYVKYSAMAKLFATDMVNRVTANAVQVLGGYGYCREYPVERMMRDAKIFAIFEGTNQIQRLVVARVLEQE